MTYLFSLLLSRAALGARWRRDRSPGSPWRLATWITW